MKKRFTIAILLGVSLCISGCDLFVNPTPPKPTPEPPINEELWDESQDSLRSGKKNLDFYNLNDFHGAVEYNSDLYEPGINYLSSYFKYLKSNNEDGTVFTSSGDMWQGSCDSNLTKGQLVVDWMNLLGFEAQAVGNHEFDWTIDVIKENIAKMDFPLLACNICDIGTNNPVNWTTPYTTVTKKGVHIGIIGAIGETLKTSILSKNVKDVEFKDPNSLIGIYADELREKGADVVLVLLHDSTTAINSSTYEKIDGLFAGHAHTRENETYGGVPAIQAGSNGKYIGHISLEYDFSTNAVVNSSGEYFYGSNSISYGIDAETKTLYDGYLNSEMLAPKYEVVSSYTGGISKENIPSLYNYYEYRYYNEFHSSDNYEITAVNTNSARSEIPSGKAITYGDIYKALPFDNTLCVISILGSNISRVCNYGYFSTPSIDVASYSDISNMCNEPNKKYYFLTIDYIATNEAKSRYVTIEKVYEEEAALPRNIVSKYLSGYPSNAHM